MCRKKQLVGVALSGFGFGMLLASFFELGFLCGCLGLIALVGGVICLQKR